MIERSLAEWSEIITTYRNKAMSHQRAWCVEQNILLQDNLYWDGWEQ